MKVILLENIAKVGKKYEVVDVAPGYARNFLISRNLGEAITPASAGRIASLRREKELVDKKHAEAFSSALEGKKGVEIEFVAKANEEGHLFAGIDREVIAEKAGAALGVSLDAEMIDLKKPIKTVGKTEVQITAGGKEVTAIVNVIAAD